MKITRKSQLVTATLSLLLYWHLLSLPREAVAQAQPAPPSLLTPLDGGSAPYQSVAFSWSPVVGATNGYRIMVAADPTALPTDPSLDSCAGCAVNTTAPLNAHVYTTALDQNAVYYWQVKALAVGGPPSAWSSQSIFTTIGTGGVIQITSPLAHASITDATVTVHGVVENLPPGEVGVTVNGSPTFASLGQFGGGIPVTAGTTTLIATAHDASGTVVARHAIPVTVPVASMPPTLSFAASPAIGAAPFTVVFNMASLKQVTAASLDADGDDVPEYTGTVVHNQPFTYQLPGVYFPTVTVVGTDNNIYKASTVVEVLRVEDLDSLLQVKWRDMKTALRGNDIQGALQYITPDKRTYYQGVFGALSVPLSSIDVVLTNISYVEELSRSAYYEMQRVDNGTTYGYSVAFVLDGDGIWRLKSL